MNRCARREPYATVFRMKKILAVEDTTESYQLIQRCLGDDYQLTRAINLKEAEANLLRDRFDLLLLDLQLPDGDGLHLCSMLRASERFDQLPVIILSARSATVDKVMAFSIGADDYLAKPFAPEELQARVAAKLRAKEVKETRAFTIQVGELEIDQTSQRVTIKNEEVREDVALTALELKILMFLSRQKKRVLTRNEILDAVWGQNVHVFARNVDTHVSKLRKKLGRLGHYIQSAHGKGYCFTPPEGKPFSGLPFSSSAPQGT
jgi:two-component system, OmpR family, phosphate regulon response regulator PhoB